MTRAMVGYGQQSAYAVGQWPGESQWLELQASHPDIPLPDYQATVSGAGGALAGYLVAKSLFGVIAGGAAGVVGFLVYDAYQRTQDAGQAFDWANWRPILQTPVR